MTEDKSGRLSQSAASKKPDEGASGRSEGTPGPFPLTQADEEKLQQLFEEWRKLIAKARQDYAKGEKVALVSEAEAVNLRVQLEKVVGELKRGGDTAR